MRRLKLALCAALFAAYAVVGLSSSRIEGLPRRVMNGLERMEDGGVRAASPALARARQPPGWLQFAIQDSALEVEIRARSHSAPQCGPARIFSVSKNASLRNLTIAQNNADLVVRLRTPDTNLNGEPAYTIPSVFSDGAIHDILLRIHGRTITLHVDGREMLHGGLPTAALGNWDSTYEVFLANEGSGNRPWLGEVHRASVRVRGKTVDYARFERLSVPEKFWALGPAPGCTDAGATRGAAGGKLRGAGKGRDMWVNLLGFVPLGLIVAVIWDRLSVGGIVLLCGALSMFIEIGQLFVSGRTPGPADLLLNIAGAAVGALLGRAAAARERFRTQS